MPFEFERLAIPEVILIKPKIFEDKRGYFLEMYKKDVFEKFGIFGDFVQDNYSKSKKGVIRGLHFQNKPYEQAKLVSCLKGEVFDVVVDLRKDSKTFCKYVSVILSEANKNILYVPRGFAHGFQSLKNGSEVLYKVDNKYSPEHESGLIWNDKDVGIKWSLDKPLLSFKDKKLPSLKRQ